MGTKWLGINEGDEDHCKIRARLVAQDFMRGKLERMFAAAPSSGAEKMLLSLAVTEEIGHGPGWHYKIDLIDVKRIYFYAPAKRNVYIKVPMNDHEEGMCGKL